MTFQFKKEHVTACSPDGIPMGYATFPRVKAGLVNINGITIFPAFRGLDVEEAMMDALFAHLDKQNLKAALTCPFAQSYVKRNPQWKHILPGEMHFTTH